MATRRAPLGRTLVCLGLAAGLWLPNAHRLFRPDVDELVAPGRVSGMARALAQRHLDLWGDPASRAREVARMRDSNAEWDFMGRTFLVLALADQALLDPGIRRRALEVMDAVIQETRRLEAEGGFRFFLLPYARHRAYVQQPEASLFVDSEVALMLGARRLVEESDAMRAPFQERVQKLATRMEAAPVHSTESYPDECWLFDNTLALVALRMAEALDGADHGALRRSWLASARARLVDPGTGLLVSSYQLSGKPLDGPEGSSLWLATYALQLVDPALARDQYQRARRELRGSLLGFGYSREWPASWKGAADVDAGMVLPGIQASPAASGLALVAARAFGDGEFLGELLTALELTGFPERDAAGGLRYAASNQVGDAVLLAALSLGPLWAEVGRRAPL